MSRKKLLYFLLFVSTFIGAQNREPVRWQAEYVKINDTEGEIKITGFIEKNWHTYSQKAVEDGPVPTSFTFTDSKNYSLIGAAEEFNVHEEYVQAFDTKLFLFSEKAEFKQKIKLLTKPGFPISFKVEYMCCDNTMCLPPKTIDLSVVTK